MFEYISKHKRSVPRLIGLAKPFVFRSAPDGSVVQSTDYSVEASNPLDFQLDNMIASNVPISDSPIVENLSLDALDSVEVNTLKLLNAEKLTVKSENNETKN